MSLTFSRKKRERDRLSECLSWHMPRRGVDGASAQESRRFRIVLYAVGCIFAAVAAWGVLGEFL